MLHVWTVNSVNRLFKNARTHYNNEPVVNLASSPGSFSSFPEPGYEARVIEGISKND